MNKKKLNISIALALVVVILALASIDVYDIRDGSSGDLLWNGEGACLFLKVGSLGYRTSYLRYFAEATRAYFRVSVPATEKSSSVVVFQIIPDSIRRYDAKQLSASTIDVVDGTIYADSDEGLMKWMGARFEHAGARDVEHFERRHISGPDFTNVDGWSKRCCVLSKGANAEIDFQLGGKPARLVLKQGEGDSSISVSLERPGQTPERIWYLDKQPRKVSKTEYEQVFGKR